MRVTTRGQQATPAAPGLHVTIDTMLEQARRLERELILLEIRRQVSRIVTSTPHSGSYHSDDRTAAQMKNDVLNVIDRTLAE